MSDYLDLRDLAKELDDLRDLRDNFIDVAEEEGHGLDEDEKDRLADLEKLESQLFTTMSEYAQNEPTLIPERDFQEYAEQLADDLGYLQNPGGREGDNPLFGYIDWARWADDLKADYTEVEFDGRTYLIRAY